MNIEHDRFMPNGRLRQLEYALEMVKRGSTGVAVCTTNCIVWATERQIKPLMIEKKVDKIMKIDQHIGCLMSGSIGEGRQIVNGTRLNNQEHWFAYDEPMPLESLIEYTASSIKPIANLANDLISFAQPVPVVFLIGGFEGDDSLLYHLDPTGTYERCYSRAVGRNRDIARKHLEENYKTDLGRTDTLKLCLRALQKAVQVEISSKDIEVLLITKQEKECQKVSDSELDLILDGLE